MTSTLVTEHGRRDAIVSQTEAVILSEPWVHHPDQPYVVIEGHGYCYKVANERNRLRWFLSKVRTLRPPPGGARVGSVRAQISRGTSRPGKAEALARLRRDGVCS
jgi:hypothetical protein